MSGRRQKATLQTTVLRWARERAGLSPEELACKMRVQPQRVLDWECTGQISVAQIDRLAAQTHTPLGFLYLPEPPAEHLPIADFRVRSGDVPPRPSPNLLETVYLMQRRQWWMNEEMRASGTVPLEFVGACSLEWQPEAVAEAMRKAFGLTPDWARSRPSWRETLAFLRERVEAAGVLIVINGVVGNSTNRKLDPDEFQGFALADEFAPLVFVNGSDFRTAQIFTLVHELAHIMIAQSGISRLENLQPVSLDVEIFCDRTAAEFLVPADLLLSFWDEIGSRTDPYSAIARRFRVSTLVAARRALDLGLIDRESFFQYYHECKYQATTPRASGGSFWRTQKLRIGLRFASAVVRAVKEGRLPYREAYALTGLNGGSFAKLGVEMGVQL